MATNSSDAATVPILTYAANKTDRCPICRAETGGRYPQKHDRELHAIAALERIADALERSVPDDR